MNLKSDLNQNNIHKIWVNNIAEKFRANLEIIQDFKLDIISPANEYIFWNNLRITDWAYFIDRLAVMELVDRVGKMSINCRICRIYALYDDSMSWYCKWIHVLFHYLSLVIDVRIRYLHVNIDSWGT